MAGTDPRFDADKFTAGILFAQNMGLPNNDADKPTFFDVDPRTYTDPDATGRPWDPRSAAVESGEAPTGRIIVCGISPDVPGSPNVRTHQTAAGEMTPEVLMLTFMPAQWEDAKTFVIMRLGGQVYERTVELEPNALFPVDIHRVVVRIPDAKGAST